jgi:hypothetical protein
MLKISHPYTLPRDLNIFFLRKINNRMSFPVLSWSETGFELQKAVLFAANSCPLKK